MKILSPALRALLVLIFALLPLLGCVPATPTPGLPSPTSPVPSATATLPAPTPTQAEPLDLTTQFRGGPHRPGTVEGEQPTHEWIFQTSGPIMASPVVSNELVYLGAMDGTFYAINLMTGDKQWTVSTSNSIGSSAVVVGDRVFFGSYDNHLYAVQAMDGQQVWRFDAGAPVLSSPAYAGGLLYVGTFEGKIFAVDAERGEQRWVYPTGDQVIASPAVVGGIVYTGSMDGYLYALDAATGELRWKFKTVRDIQGSPSVAAGLVLTGSGDGFLYALDAASGDLRWKYETKLPIYSTPSIVDGAVYFTVIDRSLVSLDLESGEKRWVSALDGESISTPGVAGDRLYAGDMAGRVYALDTATGQEVWRFQTEGEVWSSPLIAGDGLVFGSGDGRVYLIDRRGPQVALEPTAAPPPLEPTPTPLPAASTPVEKGAGGLPWWNDKVFYEVFVRSFRDSDGDGIGDLQGLIEKLDYLNDGDPTTTTDLGVTGLWLMPVTESPSYHGYDVVDYHQVEQDYGTNADLQQLIAEAHRREMTVIVDLVMNHTSNQHPWFLEAQAPGSAYENWYIWTTGHPGYTSPWGSAVWHKLGLRYYYGLFWSGMPDLNYNNGAVTKEMFDIIRFWLEEMDVDGFRLDAVRHIIEEGPVQENTESTHTWLQNFDNWVHTISPQALTVGEAWTSTEEVVKYTGDEVDIAFEFDLAAAMIESIFRYDNGAIVKAEQNVLSTYPRGQYATFLTNHDQNRAFTQLNNDPQAAKLAATLLLTHPGVPFIYYGEEIGMRGAKPDERIRTPMQWDASATAGFTSGQPWQALGPGLLALNVAVQDGDPDSLLNHYRALIRLREEHAVFRSGDMWLVHPSSRRLHSYLLKDQYEAVLVVVNLSKETVSDYTLALSSGTLHSVAQAKVLFGDGQPGVPTLNSAGGFDAYTPLPNLAPRSALVIQLKP